MFIITAKFSKRKLFFGIAVTAALLLTAGAAAHLAGDVAAMGNRADSKANDAAQQTVSTLALTDEERTAYLKACGWEVDAASCTVREVIIPSDFDETYQSYADLQARQGFDLEKLKGKRVKQVVYSVTNAEETDVLAELLIYRGKIVAGDICSMKTDGGFTRGLMDRTGQKSNDTKDTSESTSSQADSGAS